ncbi:MAG TPA: tetratricopeptide repeat protein [Thermoanaerobaculia bacterium]|jgi:serine/threonine protein kinase/tetratricopeptide (TPR) repeat protein|nr:tetratricopeptide repeat protein [Thermoanaerobaculia bacterium]
MSDIVSESGGPVPLGPFHLERRIGRGGMAEVWSGVHAVQQVPVAVKVMTGERARNLQYRASFRNEVQAVASLDHPGIVLVFDHGEVSREAEDASRGLLPAGSPCLAMELADGGTLASIARETLDWPELRRILLALLDALAHAHARGVVHRDLKPSNVLLFGDDPEGLPGQRRLKLADFGLAQAFELQVGPDSTDFVCGTPTYMAPEQLRGEWRDYGPWTDLYGLGCLAWSLAAGHPPFNETGLLQLVRLQLEEDPPSFRPLYPVPSGFEGFLRRLLQKESGRRYVRSADATWALLKLGEPVRKGWSSPALPAPPAEATTELMTLVGLLPAAAARQTVVEEPGPRESPPLPATWEHPVRRQASMKLVGAGLGLYGLRSIPLVGRGAERDLLWSALREVHETQQVRLVLLRGAAGNGKTRLAEWIAQRAHEVGGATVLRASHGPSPGAGDGLPRMAARHLRCVGLSRAETLERTERILRAWKVTDESEAAGLTDLMVPGTSEEGAGARPQTAAERFALLERHCRRLARQRPVLILLDDVHWSVEAIAFADHLLRSADLPALLLLTARDEALAERRLEAAAVAELLLLPGARALEVPPLSHGDRASLVEELLGLSGDLAAQVEERTYGNPLFAVQLVGDWVQRGVLEVGEAGFVLRPGEEARFPDDLHEVWSARVERLLADLPAGSNEALEIAAALGPTIDRQEWETSCRAMGVPCPPPLLDGLIVSHLAVRTEEGWRFVHPMLRESLERMGREAGRWPGHNRACAAMLLRRAVLGERGVAERLGRHLLLAGQPDTAVDFLLRGARERRETSDYGPAQALLAMRDDALQSLEAGRRDPRWGEGWVLRARIHLHQGQLDEVFRWAGRAVTGGSDEAWNQTRSEALRLLGDAARRRGDLSQAVNLYERCVTTTDNPHGIAASLWGLGDVLRQRGELGKARDLFERSHRLYDEIGDEHGLGDHLIGLADIARQGRDADEAERLYQEARDLFEGLGNQYGVARTLNGLGEAARLRGDLARAGGLYLQSLGILERLSSADGIFPRVNLALVDLGGGRFAEARDALEEIRHQLEPLGWGGLLACVHTARLACAVHHRDWSAWDESYARAAALLKASGLQDPDLEWAVQLAARLAEEARRPALAEAALKLR